ncbi:MAG: hypothetical protein GDA53_02260 [Rhodobacteraceae bacterium]|nr:hypothetical protein [Paracoccaceae bacterium]
MILLSELPGRVAVRLTVDASLVRPVACGAQTSAPVYGRSRGIGDMIPQQAGVGEDWPDFTPLAFYTRLVFGAVVLPGRAGT